MTPARRPVERWDLEKAAQLAAEALMAYMKAGRDEALRLRRRAA